MPAIYTAELFLKYKSALTFTRVLGAGSNNEISDIQNTQSFGIVKNAGFVISGSNLNAGFVQFISAKHDIVATEAIGYPIFTNNDSITDLDSTHLLRGMLFFTTVSRAILAPSSTGMASLRPLGSFLPGPTAMTVPMFSTSLFSTMITLESSRTSGFTTILSANGFNFMIFLAFLVSFLAVLQ